MSAPPKVAAVYVRAADMKAVFGIARATAYRLLKTDPTFPRPRKITTGTVAWKASEVERWMDSRGRA